MSTLPGGFYDYLIDQTSMQAEFIPIEHRESPKTLDLVTKFNELSKQELSPLNNTSSNTPCWYNELETKTQKLSKAVIRLERVKKNPLNPVIKGCSLGFLGGSSAGALLFTCLSLGTPPGACLLGTILTAGIVGSVFGTIIGKHLTVNNLLKSKNCIIKQEQELKTLLLDNKALIKKQLSNEKLNQETHINSIDEILWLKTISYTPEEEKQEDYELQSHIRGYLTILDDALDLLERFF